MEEPLGRNRPLWPWPSARFALQYPAVRVADHCRRDEFGDRQESNVWYAEVDEAFKSAVRIRGN